MTIELKDAPQVVIMLLVLGVFLYVGALTFEQIQTSQETNRAVINNTPLIDGTGEINFTAIDTEFSLSHNNVNETFFIRILNDSVSISNQTNIFPNSVKDGNWTVNTATGKIQIHGETIFAASPTGSSGAYNVSYTWVEGNTAIDSLTSSQSAITNISNFQGTMGTVLAASILIGLVMSALLLAGKGDKSRGGL